MALPGPTCARLTISSALLLEGCWRRVLPSPRKANCLSKGEECRDSAGFGISTHRRIRRNRVQCGQEIRPVACRLPTKSMKVGAAGRWPQTKRLFYPLRDDPAAKSGPFQNVETAEPVARSRQVET